VISNRIRKIISVDHDNQQSGKAAGDNMMWSSVSTKDAGNLTYLKHARKILDYALASVRHAQGLHLPTRIDTVRLRLRPFAYDSAYPSELSNEPSEPSSKPTRLLIPIAYHVAMITVKNGVITIATTAMMIGQKARGPSNFIAADQTLYLKISTSLYMNI